MHLPTVTFIVPCYNLGHLLDDCVRSILMQTYEDLEILVMDDCSPDNTPEVAQSFRDPRVKHLRNETNLGHLRNYNHGISLAKGKYIWLISADDRLHSDSVLQRYIELLDASPTVGYAFCPAFRLEDGEVKELLDYSVFGSRDQILNGRRFLDHLIYANTVVAPTVLVRKECYDKISVFPLNMPWGGDWYLWCIFALHYDVAYFADPMVCYRRHAGSMTNHLMNGRVASCSHEDIELPWIVRQQAQQLGFKRVVRSCELAIAKEYARTLATTRYTGDMPEFSEEDFLHSLATHTASPNIRRRIRANTYTAIGDILYWKGDAVQAQHSYRKAVLTGQWLPQVWVQYTLLSSGRVGIRMRQHLGSMRRKLYRSQVG